MQTLRKGMKGDDVRTLQKMLTASGYATVIDGIFGTGTEALVRRFQVSKGVKGDGIVGPVTWALLGAASVTSSTATTSTKKGAIDASVVYNPISVHMTSCSHRTPKYLVIHYTAGASSARGGAVKNREVFLKREASADFIVDDAVMLQVNPDPRSHYCWAVGDKTNYRMRGADGALVNNRDCVSIEICCNHIAGTNADKPNHQGWTFTKAAIDNAVRLARIIMRTYGIPISRVLRHYDVTHKSCPGIIGWNDTNLYTTAGVATGKKNNSTEWERFKAMLVL